VILKISAAAGARANIIMRCGPRERKGEREKSCSNAGGGCRPRWHVEILTWIGHFHHPRASGSLCAITRLLTIALVVMVIFLFHAQLPRHGDPQHSRCRSRSRQLGVTVPETDIR